MYTSDRFWVTEKKIQKQLHGILFVWILIFWVPLADFVQNFQAWMQMVLQDSPNLWHMLKQSQGSFLWRMFFKLAGNSYSLRQQEETGREGREQQNKNMHLIS